jgi:putative nucleotidyltransferase with HDIG domain
MKGAPDKVREIIERITNLPTPPLVLQQINKTINDPNASAYDVAAILSEDPAMSMKVLRMSNSVWYGLKQEVTSIKQAVIIMGMEAIRSIVLSTAVFEMFNKDVSDLKFREEFWRHSLAAATCMRLLVRAVSGQWITKGELAFAAGLLHDIGKLVIYSYLHRDFEAAVAFRTENSTTWLKAEEAAVGYTHSDIGAALAEKWDLPAQLRQAIEFHHYPDRPEDGSGIAHFAYMANHIAHITFDDDDNAYAITGPIHAGVCKMLGVGEDQMTQFSDSLRNEYAKAETFIQMATGQ